MDYASQLYNNLNEENLVSARELINKFSTGTHIHKKPRGSLDNDKRVDVYFEDWSRIELTCKEWKWVRGW